MDNAAAGATEGALITLDAITAVQVFAPGNVDPLLAKIKAEVRAVATDVSTAKGRAAIKSLAYKVVRSKTLLDDMGKDLTAELKKQTGSIDAERKRIRDELDALRDEVRKPVDDFDAAEESRIATHEAALLAFEQALDFGNTHPTAGDIEKRLAQVPAIDARDWQEFTTRATAARDTAVGALTGRLESARKAEAEAAETARLASLEAERARLQAIKDQEEREARIAAEAAEAAKIEAERVAQAAAAAEAKRVEDARLAAQQAAEQAAQAAETERLRVERERQAAELAAREAEKRAAQAERERVAAVAKAEADRVAAEKRAKEAKAEAARAAEVERLAAAKREKDAAEVAAKAERDRIESERQAEAKAAAKREANKAHKARINTAAVQALVDAGLSESAAKLAITAIAEGDVPAVTISY